MARQKAPMAKPTFFHITEICKGWSRQLKKLNQTCVTSPSVTMFIDRTFKCEVARMFPEKTRDARKKGEGRHDEMH